eukprot:TRINITY_DN1052_c0_g1_i2.p1 TRINITY_DN1052_c0_g1~~TRINITY_DN1052_c0_g1_i2.p1  ORF type:complete len:239 (-),score=31.27 TRINITY_DN1052_c0_g1_i2:136-852(-)
MDLELMRLASSIKKVLSRSLTSILPPPATVGVSGDGTPSSGSRASSTANVNSSCNVVKGGGDGGLRLLVRCQVSRRGGDSIDSFDQHSKEGEWLASTLKGLLESEGHLADESEAASRACGEALEEFLRMQASRSFDPLVLMDVLEEGIERRNARGDFLPFELGGKAGKLLLAKWQGSSRPKGFSSVLKENQLDFVQLSQLQRVQSPQAPPSRGWDAATSIFYADEAMGEFKGDSNWRK